MTDAPGTHTELTKRHQAVMPSWLSLFYDQPIEIVSGDGRHVTDGEGNTYQIGRAHV